MGRINHLEGMPLGNQSLEATLVEDVDEAFLYYHLVELPIEGCAVFSRHLLNAYRLANGILGVAGLVDLRDVLVGIHDDLDFLLATLMTVQRQSGLLLLCDSHHSSRVAQDIAVH